MATNKGKTKLARSNAGKEERFIAVPSLKRTRGRPDEYDPRLLDTVRHLAWAGCTDYEIAEAIGISVVTLIKWQAAHPDFIKVLNSAKDGYDDRIERTLAARAMGYRYEAEKIHISADGNVTRVPYIHHEPPNVTAMIFWLKNRRPQRWREQTDLSVGGTMRVEGRVEHEHIEAPSTERELALAVLTLMREAATQPVELETPTINGETNELGTTRAAGADPAGEAASPVAADRRTGEGETSHQRHDHRDHARRRGSFLSDV